MSDVHSCQLQKFSKFSRGNCLLFSFEMWYTCSSKWKEAIPLFYIFFTIFLRVCFKISGSHFPIWNFLANGLMNLTENWPRASLKAYTQFPGIFPAIQKYSIYHGTLLVHNCMEFWGLWDRQQCGGMYGVSQRRSMFGVETQEYSGDGGWRLCPLTLPH